MTGQTPSAQKFMSASRYTEIPMPKVYNHVFFPHSNMVIVWLNEEILNNFLFCSRKKTPIKEFIFEHDQAHDNFWMRINDCFESITVYALQWKQNKTWIKQSIICVFFSFIV